LLEAIGVHRLDPLTQRGFSLDIHRTIMASAADDRGRGQRLVPRM
jgi:hypothetical protein